MMAAGVVGTGGAAASTAAFPPASSSKASHPDRVQRMAAPESLPRIDGPSVTHGNGAVQKKATLQASMSELCLSQTGGGAAVNIQGNGSDELIDLLTRSQVVEPETLWQYLAGRGGPATLPTDPAAALAELVGAGLL